MGGDQLIPCPVHAPGHKGLLEYNINSSELLVQCMLLDTRGYWNNNNSIELEEIRSTIVHAPGHKGLLE